MTILTPQQATSERPELTNSKISELNFRNLQPGDGMALHQLISACPPLDQNSAYCNLLQCSHFRATSIAAFNNGQLIGSITGYLVPDRQDTLFIWQVAVHQSARGIGLARTMLNNLLDKQSAQGVRYIETSITPDNDASLRLFTRLAKDKAAAMNRSVMFDKSEHFKDAHDTEYLYRIGPLQ